MAYNYQGIAQTQTGTIIYKRKKHSFTVADLLRLIKHVEYPSEPAQQLTWIHGLLAMLLRGLAIPHSEIRTMIGELSGALLIYAQSELGLPGDEDPELWTLKTWREWLWPLAP